MPLEACLLLKGLLVVLVVDRWWCTVWVAILLAPLDPLKRKGIEASLTEVISRIKCRWQEAEPNQAAGVDGEVEELISKYKKKKKKKLWWTSEKGLASILRRPAKTSAFFFS